jgi:hypothetical protein
MELAASPACQSMIDPGDGIGTAHGAFVDTAAIM